MMIKQCLETNESFEIGDKVLALYEKLAVPLPSLSPDARQQRRLAFRNERNLYFRQCDSCGKRIVAVYPEKSIFSVYCPQCWWSDHWSGEEFGQAPNTELPFFKQFSELLTRVPKISFSNKNSENSEYCNMVASLKNCYLLIGSIHSQDSMYGTRVLNSKDCLDCTWVNQCELCYQLIDCQNCYACTYAQDCSQVRDSSYVYDCLGCSNLIFCAGLRHKNYCILNKELSKTEFEITINKILSSADLQAKYFQQFQALLLEIPIRAVRGQNYENCLGEYITESKNGFNVFNVGKLEDVAYAYEAIDLKNSCDIYSFYGPGELCYEVPAGGLGLFQCFFTDDCLSCKNLSYCSHCYHCSDCFGCVGLRRKENYIFNIPYTPSEYQKLKQRLIEQMCQTKEWGEFFPIELSTFCYNETVAQEWFPRTQEEVLKRGWKWKTEVIDTPKNETEQANLVIIKQTDNEILAATLFCSHCNKPYHIQKPELAFYRKMSLSLPTLCPNDRHLERAKKRRQNKLYQRLCDASGHAIISTIAPDSQYKVYCEKEYDQIMLS